MVTPCPQCSELLCELGETLNHHLGKEREEVIESEVEMYKKRKNDINKELTLVVPKTKVDETKSNVTYSFDKKTKSRIAMKAVKANNAESLAENYDRRVFVEFDKVSCDPDRHDSLLESIIEKLLMR